MNSRNQIVKSGFFSVMQIITATISYASIYIVVILELGKPQLGVWSIITGIPAAITFLSSGVCGSILRYLPLHHSKGENFAIAKILINGVLFNLILAIIIVFPAFVFAEPILKFIFGIKLVPQLFFKFFNLTLITFVVTFCGSVFLAGLDGLKLIPLKNKILIFSSVLFSIGAVLLIYSLGLTGLFYAQLFQAVLVFVIGGMVLYREGRYSTGFSMIDRDVMRLFYIYGGRLQYISLLTMFFEPVVKFFLNKYFGLGTVGTYDLVNRIVTQLRTLIVNSVQVIVPFVAGSSENKSFEVTPIYIKAFRGTLLTVSILFGLLLTAGFSFVYLFKDIVTQEFQVVLIYLASANIINTLSIPGYSMFLGLGKLNKLVISHVIASGLNLILFLLFGPYMKQSLILLPTLVATVISSLFVIVSFRMYYVKRPLVHHEQDFMIYACSILFPVILIVISKYYFNLPVLMTGALLHFIIILLLIFKNDYLMLVLNVILRNKKFQNTYE